MEVPKTVQSGTIRVPVTNVHQIIFGVALVKHRASYIMSDPILLMKWEWYPFSIFMKWRWYFRYRQCLFQIQFPKNFIEMREYQVPADSKSVEIKLMKNKLTKAKADVTKITNLIKKAEENWNQLFPITEDALYHKAMAKLCKKQNDMIELERKLKKLKD